MTNNLTRGVDVGESTQAKRCKKCGIVKPVSDFHLRDGKPLARCKPCALADRRDASRRWRDRNPEKVKESFKSWLDANRQHNVDRVREWRAVNPAAVAVFNRQFYEKAKRDPDFLAAKSEQGRRYYEANREYVLLRQDRLRRTPEGRRAAVLKQAKRRARKAATQTGPVDLSALWTASGGRCGICHGQLDPTFLWPDPASPSVDHVIPLAGGGAHSQENLQWAHLVCNMRKGARLVAEQAPSNKGQADQDEE